MIAKPPPAVKLSPAQFDQESENCASTRRTLPPSTEARNPSAPSEPTTIESFWIPAEAVSSKSPARTSIPSATEADDSSKSRARRLAEDHQRRRGVVHERDPESTARHGLAGRERVADVDIAGPDHERELLGKIRPRSQHERPAAAEIDALRDALGNGRLQDHAGERAALGGQLGEHQPDLDVRAIDRHVEQDRGERARGGTRRRSGRACLESARELRREVVHRRRHAERDHELTEMLREPVEVQRGRAPAVHPPGDDAGVLQDLGNLLPVEAQAREPGALDGLRRVFEHDDADRLQHGEPPRRLREQLPSEQELEQPAADLREEHRGIDSGGRLVQRMDRAVDVTRLRDDGEHIGDPGVIREGAQRLARLQGLVGDGHVRRGKARRIPAELEQQHAKLIGIPERVFERGERPGHLLGDQPEGAAVLAHSRNLSFMPRSTSRCQNGSITSTIA